MPADLPSGLHLFLGPDRPAKLQRIQALERALAVASMDRHRLDGATVGSAALLALCRQQPALSGRRLIVVEQAQRLEQACVDALMAHAATIAMTSCVILLAEQELGVRHALSRAEGIITERFAGRAAVMAKPFALADALGARDVGGALEAAREQLSAGKEPVEILSLMIWQLNRWVMVKQLTRRHHSAAQIAAMTGLKPWQVERIESETARRPLDSLQGLLERCWQLDGEIKTGRAIPELALEQFIVEVCAGGEPAAKAAAG